jgi:16S rRNA (guanine527-N7)-methyltransferase
MPVWKPEDGFPEGCTVFLPFQDPENIGAAVRSAVAFGASQGVLLKESAHPFHPKALRASGGAVLDLPLRQGPGLDALPLNIPVIALSVEGRELQTLRFPKAFGLLAGVEGPGLPDAWRNRAVAIPMAGRIESLNAATALSVVLYEWSRRRGN